MKNYGEELAHWYFRLNGFFLIDNFVLHQEGANRARTSDADLLAVRFPFVSEEIGGQKDDWDCKLFDSFGDYKAIGLICEIKTGGFNSESIFKRVNVEKALKRLGFTKNMEAFTDCVMGQAVTDISGFKIAKVLISRKRSNPRSDCLYFKLSDIDRFIQHRMKKYMDRKFNDRMFFPSSLMQYLIWKKSISRS